MKTYFKWAFVLSLLGVLFSGYLSSVKLLTDTCAFNEPCPYFFGYPSCWYGFGLFLLLFIFSVSGLFSAKKYLAGLNSFISFLGILFAGYFTIPEMKNWMAGATEYGLGLPTCSYGLVFFVIIFVISISVYFKRN